MDFGLARAHEMQTGDQGSTGRFLLGTPAYMAPEQVAGAAHRIDGRTDVFLSGVARALKPGARFIIETGMAAESTLTKFEPETSHQIEDILVTIKEQYLAEESCIDTEYVFERNGVVESRKAKHWIYTVGEIRRMLERAGFKVQNLYGSLKLEPYVLGSEELFVIANKVRTGSGSDRVDLTD
jgi:serine/threonine protein kinase